jgi:3D (Asp-Asp-Asp) domain-containing protein
MGHNSIPRHPVHPRPIVNYYPSENKEDTAIKKIINVEATFYCNCPECCGQWAEIGLTASGTIPVEGKTIAVDPEIIPLGSEIIFITVPNGMEYLKTNPDGSDKIFCAEDTGNPDYISGQRIDIYLNDHDLAIELGVKEMQIEVLPK